MAVMATAHPIDILIRLLGEGRFDYSDESECQRQIAVFLTERGVTFTKEHDLGGAGICDFYFTKSRIVLEVKAGKQWNKREVYRQCERYCRHDEVQGLVLATGRIQGMPPTICGKPVRVYQLGLGFL